MKSYAPTARARRGKGPRTKKQMMQLRKRAELSRLHHATPKVQRHGGWGKDS